jgi:hypothetical protein
VSELIKEYGGSELAMSTAGRALDFALCVLFFDDGFSAYIVSGPGIELASRKESGTSESQDE